VIQKKERHLEVMGFVAVFIDSSVSFSVFSTRTNLEKKLAQATTKYEEEKASVKKHHSTIAKVRFLFVLLNWPC